MLHASRRLYRLYRIAYRVEIYNSWLHGWTIPKKTPRNTFASIRYSDQCVRVYACKIGLKPDQYRKFTQHYTLLECLLQLCLQLMNFIMHMTCMITILDACTYESSSEYTTFNFCTVCNIILCCLFNCKADICRVCPTREVATD